MLFRSIKEFDALWQKGRNVEAVQDMALPDALAFSRPDQPALNSSARQQFGVGANLGLSLWKVAAD